jgi:hypothetical protein
MGSCADGGGTAGAIWVEQSADYSCENQGMPHLRNLDGPGRGKPKAVLCPCAIVCSALLPCRSILNRPGAF